MALNGCEWGSFPMWKSSVSNRATSKYIEQLETFFGIFSALVSVCINMFDIQPCLACYINIHESQVFNLLVRLNMVFQPPKQDTQLMCSKNSALLHRYTARLWSEWAEVSGSLEAPQRKFAGNTMRRYAQLYIYTIYICILNIYFIYNIIYIILYFPMFYT